jgi:hypothetical protein
LAMSCGCAWMGSREFFLPKKSSLSFHIRFVDCILRVCLEKIFQGRFDARKRIR